MRLTKQTGYALRILVDCAKARGDLVTVAEIAARHHITEFNLFKTLPAIVQGGFVESLRGRNGGLRLAMPADDIRIGDVVMATESTQLQADCTGQDPVQCAIRPATPVNRIFDEALSAFIDVLNQHTVADLAQGRRPMPPLPEARPARRQTRAKLPQASPAP